EVERDLRGETVDGDRLHHAVRRKIQAGEKRRDRHGAVGHRAAIGDVLRNFEGGSVGPRQQLIPGVAARLPAAGNLKSRLGGTYQARDWQQGAKNQGGQGRAKPSTAWQTAHGASFGGALYCPLRDIWYHPSPAQAHKRRAVR